MARIRTIKPEFFTSADILRLTPLARLFYVSLWCEADREGYLPWNPETLKYRYLPKDQIDIETLAAELLESELIVILIGDDEREYAHIPSFKMHQVINNREAPSVLDARVKGACARVKAEGREGRKGKEGKEGKGTSPALPPDAEGGDEKSPKTRKRHGSDNDHKAARWMFELVQTVNATAKEPNYDHWADDIRLMREIDGRKHEEICELFGWAKQDAFWSPNIQSPAKLREKWDTLFEKRTSPVRAGTAVPNQKFHFGGVDRSGDRAAMDESMRRNNIIVPTGDDPIEI